MLKTVTGLIIHLTARLLFLWFSLIVRFIQIVRTIGRRCAGSFGILSVIAGILQHGKFVYPFEILEKV